LSHPIAHDQSSYLVQYIRSFYVTGSLTEPDLNQLDSNSYVANTIYIAYTAGGPEAAEQVIADLIRYRPELAAAISRRKFYTPDQVLAFTPPKFLIDGMVAECELNLLFGLPGAGKSHVALDIAMQVAQHHNVVYLAGEGKSGFSLRYRGWMKHHGLSAANITLTTEPFLLTEAEEVGRFIEDVSPLQPGLIVLDTFATCTVGLNENDKPSMSIAVDACKRIIREVGAAVLLVHHTGWDGNHERGSNVLRSDIFSAAKVTQSNGVITVTSAKLRDGLAFSKYTLRLEGGDDYVSAIRVDASEATAKEQSLYDYQLSILAFLADCQDDGASASGVATAMKDHPNTTTNRLKALIGLGLVEQDGAGKPYVITSAGIDVLAEHEDDLAA